MHFWKTSGTISVFRFGERGKAAVEPVGVDLLVIVDYA
jgi:hypothetical protein